MGSWDEPHARWDAAKEDVGEKWQHDHVFGLWRGLSRGVRRQCQRHARADRKIEGGGGHGGRQRQISWDSFGSQCSTFAPVSFLFFGSVNKQPFDE
jgi:hypothetical protein